MFGKPLFFGILVVVGAVLPYLLADHDWRSGFDRLLGAEDSAEIQSEDDSKADGNKAGALADSNVGEPEAATEVAAPSLTATPNASVHQPTSVSPNATQTRTVALRTAIGPPGVPIEHLLSFDTTMEWLSANWTRVTTRLAELDLQGWRVAVSLSDEYELSGSITYYFDRQRRVQRIILHGYSGNAAGYIRLGTLRYQMKRVPRTVSELYVASVDGQALGALHVDYTPVLKADHSRRHEILMELNRAGSSYGMSDSFLRLLQKTQDERQQLTPIPALNLDDFRPQ